MGSVCMCVCVTAIGGCRRARVGVYGGKEGGGGGGEEEGGRGGGEGGKEEEEKEGGREGMRGQPAAP